MSILHDLASPERLAVAGLATATMATKAAVVLALGIVAARLGRHTSASTRHLVWTLTLTGALAAPIATAVVAGDRRPGVRQAPAGTVAPAVTPARPASSADAAAVLAAPSARPAPPGPGPRTGWSELAPWAAAVWLTGVLLALARLVAGTLRLALLARRARPLRGGQWAPLVPTAMREIGVRRPVRMAELDGRVMPMTWGVIRPVVLLPAGTFDSTVAERLDVLRHELAHVRRLDCLTQLIGRLACAVHWYNPLAWFAARQLRLEREHACDDEVLRAGTKASAYADYLLRVARTTHLPGPASFAAVAMARPSQLARRVLAVLDERRARSRVSTPTAAGATLAAAVIVAGVASLAPATLAARSQVIPTPQRLVTTTTDYGFRQGPLAPDEAPWPAPRVAGPPVAPPAPLTARTDAAAPAPASPALERRGQAPAGAPAECERKRGSHDGSHTSVTGSANGAKRWRVLWSDGECSYEMDARGDIKFNRDVTDVESISPGGSFVLEQHVADDTRRLVIRPNGSGALERTYTVNGARREYDAAARAWFAEALVALDRQTAFAAEQRVPAILERGGVDAVLDEISLIGGDYARRRYYTTLLSLRTLDAAQVQRVVDQAGAGIASDYELAELLIALSTRYALDDRTRASFIRAVGSIESDYEHRRVLSAAIAGEALPPAVSRALLEDARRIASDYELAEFLIAMGRKGAIDASTRDAYFAAANTLESDYEHRRALTPLLTRDLLTAELAKSVLESATKIESDYECASLLVQLASVRPIDDDLRAAYDRAAATIGSDYEHDRAMAAARQRR